ncbi:MAG: phosphoadenylyl-sulfate reductase [Sedimenticola thiotaurini]|uniref:Adenosine 5'-phosphosulfate reductase n=1 Tax=Sedimenticola thiotaurini TaxID=1543721 RepID=A0A558CPG3_9GAMM|nr:phosphoadenylyl-sulfate reductase [Sedimenticola sp.]TVT50645.1 MAG: phosphoadenylyl-sulfate reductase [Sedimenticola thiotaurini]
MSISILDVQRLAENYDERSPEEIISLALETVDNIAISFSGAEDVVLVDMAVQINPNVKVFSLDTGRLHPETYRYLEEVRNHYGIKLDVVSPVGADVEKLVREKGLYSFLNDGHKECCTVRKVAPLRRKLATLSGWITGQRKDQSIGTRTEVPVIQEDPSFSTEESKLLKFNPLANWTSAQVWEYIRTNEVPYNPLHAQGFTSIGCEPCTRAVLPNQHEREGRWWWEDAADKECGLHAGNVAAKAAAR